MKEYFAKYLPVEGEIKEGDVLLSEDKGYHKFNGFDLDEDEKKVKLFLCSRDIQIGGKVYIEKYNQFGIIDDSPFNTKDKFEVGHQIPPELFYKKELFKVLGEVSSEAIWVKEGDEFDEDDWELWGHHKDGFIIEKVDKDCLNEDWLIINKCKIKNSTCKHFH